ncbi:MAG: Gfo/Idh/MocA family oxidoreductase [Pirellulales bacterium]
MSEPFRLAFLGIDHPHGAGWRESLANLGDKVALTAIMPGFGGGTTSLEERYSSVERFDSVEALVEGGRFDGAVVCLPNNQAPDAIIRLAQAGKHILAEKPVAGSAADAARLREAVQTAGVAFQNGYAWRYDEAANRLRQMLADGRFGRLISVEMSYFTSDAARRGPTHYLFDRAVSGGGFFNWLACHWLDLLPYIVGQPVVGVTARVGVFGSTALEVEDGGVAVMDLAGGGIATLVGGYWLPRWASETHWCLRGSDRWVHWDPARPGTGGVLEIHGPQPQWHAMEETYTLQADSTPGYCGYRAVGLIDDWIASARDLSGARGPCRNTPASTAATLELIDAIYRSSHEGRRISLE